MLFKSHSVLKRKEEEEGEEEEGRKEGEGERGAERKIKGGK